MAGVVFCCVAGVLCGSEGCSVAMVMIVHVVLCLLRSLCMLLFEFDCLFMV